VVKEVMAIKYGNTTGHSIKKFLGHIGKFEIYIFLKFRVITEKHADGIPRHARHDRSAILKEALELRGFLGDDTS
jgi:hypothetical protein